MDYLSELDTHMFKCKSKDVSFTESFFLQNLFTDDKTELMRERMRLEKVNKSGENTTEGQKKRKNQKNGEGQKKKKLETGPQAESDREMEKKAKEKEEKRKKKEDEQRRKDFLLQTRKAQVAERWSSTCSDTATFRPEPLHRASQITPAPRAPAVQPTTPASRPRPDQAIIPASTPAQAQPRTPASRTTPPSPTTQAQSRTPASCQTQARPRTPASASCPTPPSHTRQALPRTPAPSPTPDQATTPASQTAKQPARRRQETTPRTSVQTKRASDSRRGIHFQNAVGDSSEDEVSEESDEDCIGGVADEGGNCCREHKLENEALRKRLEKLHKRLNIACKSSDPANCFLLFLNGLMCKRCVLQVI